MSRLAQIESLKSLTPPQRAFVLLRARGKQIKDIAKELNLNSTTLTLWGGRDEIAAAIIQVQEVIYLSPSDAVQHLLGESIDQLGAAVRRGDRWAIQEVLNRSYGYPVQPQHLDVSWRGQLVAAGVNPDAILNVVTQQLARSLAGDPSTDSEGRPSGSPVVGERLSISASGCLEDSTDSSSS